MLKEIIRMVLPMHLYTPSILGSIAGAIAGPLIGKALGGKSSQQSQNQQTSSTPTFELPEGKKLLGQLSGFSEQFGETRGDAVDFNRQMLGQTPGQVNPYTQQITDLTRQRFQTQLDPILQNTRSRFFRSPNNVNQQQLNTTTLDALRGMELGLANMANTQVNQDIANQMGAAGNLQNLATTDISQGLNFLNLLRGTTGSGQTQVAGSSFDPLGAASSGAKIGGDIGNRISGWLGNSGGSSTPSPAPRPLYETMNPQNFGNSWNTNFARSGGYIAR